MSDTNVILIELNELTPALVDRFIEAGELPNFARLRGESQVYVTDAKARGEDLNPWVQWVTVHTGLDLEEHGIRFLSDGHKLTEPAIWDVVSRQNLPVLVFGSMNGRYDDDLNGFVVPDPWSSGVAPHPASEFDTFYSFIRSAVQAHTNPDGIPGVSTLDFVKWMARHGLSLETVARVAWQLLAEKVRPVDWKKAMILDRFQWDAFSWYYARQAPRFATFFSNSTAHYQHRFWRCMEPELFAAKPSDADLAAHKDAILCGYRNADDLIGRFLALADENTTLVFCTALGQQPYLGHESTGWRIYYRLKDAATLVNRLGLAMPFSYEPVMAEQFLLRFDNAEEGETARQLLGSATTEGQGATFHIQGTSEELLVRCRQTGDVPDGTKLQIAGRDVAFFDVFYRVSGVKSSYHHPDGILWIRQPSRAHAVHPDKVPLRDIAPTVLDLLGIDVPPSMRGRSLFAPAESAPPLPSLTSAAG